MVYTNFSLPSFAKTNVGRSTLAKNTGSNGYIPSLKQALSTDMVSLRFGSVSGTATQQTFTHDRLLNAAQSGNVKDSALLTSIIRFLGKHGKHGETKAALKQYFENPNNQAETKTQREIANALGITQGSISPQFQKLVEEEFLIKTGERRDAKYRLNPNRNSATQVEASASTTQGQAHTQSSEDSDLNDTLDAILREHPPQEEGQDVGSFLSQYRQEHGRAPWEPSPNPVYQQPQNNNSATQIGQYVHDGNQWWQKIRHGNRNQPGTYQPTGES